MYAVRRWVVRHARGFERLYQAFEPLLVKLHPVWRRIGYDRVEAPVAAVEKGVKGALFDCRMCGQCVLSSTGMSCPMNCPKNLRNGPCGGVRQDGGCEVVPEMRCVWIDAWEGSRRMRYGDRIQVVQEPVDHRLQGSSSWLRVVREKAEEARQSSQGGAET
ncbi:MAG: methylenetetrahydrofolate reductase C-terminal domain-containing protein [Pseudomonadota bacterium]